MGLFVLNRVLILILFCSGFTASYAEETPKPTPHLRYGFELELGVRPLSRMLVYFDLTRVGETAFSERLQYMHKYLDASYLEYVLQDYVANPRVWQALKPDVWAKISEGLRLEVKHLAQPVGLVDPEGNALQSDRPAIVLYDAQGNRKETPAPTATPIPDTPEGRGFVPSGALVVPMSVDWNTLLKRWNALPLETRMQNVRFDLLSAERQAFFMIKAVLILRRKWLKPNIPKWFNYLDWAFDGATLEFKIREEIEITDPDAYLDLLKNVAQAAGIWNLLQDPDKGTNNESFSYHIHFSVHRFPFERAVQFEEVLQLYNILTAVRIAGVDKQNEVVFGGKGFNRFAFSLSFRGVIRQFHEGHHAEVREHALGAAEEIAELRDIFLGSYQESYRKLATEIVERMTPNIFRELIASAGFSSNHRKNYFELLEELPLQKELLRSWWHETAKMLAPSVVAPGDQKREMLWEAMAYRLSRRKIFREAFATVDKQNAALALWDITSVQDSETKIMSAEATHRRAEILHFINELYGYNCNSYFIREVDE